VSGCSNRQTLPFSGYLTPLLRPLFSQLLPINHDQLFFLAIASSAFWLPCPETGLQPPASPPVLHSME
jgi:hypothetical protein